MELLSWAAVRSPCGATRCALIGAYDKNPIRSQAVAEQYGCRIYETLDALIQDSAVDAVYVRTANAQHAEVSIAALNAGKPVTIRSSVTHAGPDNWSIDKGKGNW